VVDIRIVEVGPRDGLQNEPVPVATADKLHLIDLLAEAGCRDIEVGAFVNPTWVPQMAGSDDVVRGLNSPAFRPHVLIPNLKGLARYLEASGPEASGTVAVFVAASEGFSKANLNADIATSLVRAGQVIRAAQDAGLATRGYVSCVTHCPYDGPTSPEDVARVATELAALGADEISLGETLGRATAEETDAMLKATCARMDPEHLAGHFHDTAGRALDSVDVAMGHGLRCFDSSAGGLGGCPYAPGAAGNLATEALLQHLSDRGYTTGLDPDRLSKAANFARSLKSRNETGEAPE